MRNHHPHQRGCPYKCTFCSKPVTGDTWRRSVESVVQEWRVAGQGAGRHRIGVTDDIWNLKLPRQRVVPPPWSKGLNTVPWVTVTA